MNENRQQFSIIQATPTAGGILLTEIADNTQMLTKAARGVLIAVFTIIVWSAIGGSIWPTRATGVAVHSLLAYLAMIGASLSVLVAKRKDTASLDAMYSMFFFIAIVNLMCAGRHLFGTSIMLGNPIFQSTLNLYELAVIGTLSLISVMGYESIPIRNRRPESVIVLVISVAGYLILTNLLANVISNWVFSVVGLACSAVAICTLVIAAVISFRNSAMSKNFNQHVLLTGMSLLGLSALLLRVAPFDDSTIWAISILLQIGGLVAYVLSFSTPLMQSAGVSRKNAQLLITLLGSIAIAPLLVTIFAQLVAPRLVMIDVGAYLFSHAGAAVLSAVMAFLLFMHSSRKPTASHAPLILLFITWAAAEIFLMVLSQASYFAIAGEHQAPHVVSSLVLLVILFMAIKTTSKPPHKKPVQLSTVEVLIFVAVLISMFIIAIAVESSATLGYVVIQYNLSGKALLLLINLIAMFELTYLAVRLAMKAGGRFSVDLLAVYSLVLWILPNILKAIFDDWTVGWWIAEVAVFGGLLMGLAILGALYVTTMHEAETSRKYAGVFADLLVHDISNYHQVILGALDLMELGELTPEVEERTFRNARQGLGRAHHLVRNVRLLGMTEVNREKLFVPVNLVATLSDAYEQASLSLQNPSVKFFIAKVKMPCFVMADKSLTDAFVNIFRNSILYSPKKKRIDVHIKSTYREERKYWEISIADHGKGIERKRRPELFTRFMKGAKGSGLGLSVVLALVTMFGGYIRVEDKVSGNHTKGSVFIVTLPAAEVPQD